MAKIRATYHQNQGFMRGVMSAEGMVGSAMRRAANLTAKRASANVTRYGRVRTGKMRDTIKAGKLTRVGPSRNRIMVSSGVPYGVFQHEGTSRGITPAPFLADALRALRPEDFQPANRT